MKNVRNQNFIDDRLWYIEWLLRMKGWFSRTDLMDKFGIKEAAASRDIRMYKDMRADNFFFNQSVKRYEVDLNKFQPVFDVPSDTLFSKLTDPDESRSLGASESLIETIPVLAESNVEIADLTRAILNKKIQSDKRVAPHAMFNNDLKTYFRCYDFGHSKFLDLVVGRIIDLSDTNDLTPDIAQGHSDIDWNTYLSLELVVHPRVKHKQAIEKDMQMVDGVKQVSVRRALAHYWLRRWCVDCSEKATMSDSAYQLHLKNHEVIKDVHGYFPGVNNHVD
ncbi:hypothetical protein AS587_15920 [Salmonella enterica subsp. enterica serovar Anatum]|uniref:hypothetical protein n=1 Tax=Salmonella enterica TaxID=28901 RepID=UPI0007225F97|nr:hypothetical protein [Salmonella enterica]ALO84975.1 hypothetical protein AS587_15920 [Salmonella enterica subsp. enterica serovar Anatum]